MAYAEERRAFQNLKSALEADAELCGEYERAIASVVRDYNTSIYENRFVVGGAVELFTLWALRAGGIDAQVVGGQLTGADIQLPRGGRFSVKCSFALRTGDIRLINVQGTSAAAAWTHSTLFLVAGQGLTYADPEYLPGATRRISDAVVIRWRHVQELVEAHPELRISIEIPAKSDLTAQSKVASRAVALDVIDSLGLVRLRRGLA